MVVSTPKVLERKEVSSVPEQVTANSFVWLSDPPAITITLFQTQYPEGTKATAEPIIDARLKYFEEGGYKFSLSKNEKFQTPNSAEGAKVFGSGTTDFAGNSEPIDIEYTLLIFVAESYTQELFISWPSDDPYSKQIAERVINSVELQKAETK